MKIEKKTVIFLAMATTVLLLVFFRDNICSFVSKKSFEQAEKYFDHANYNILKAEKLYRISLFFNDHQKSAHYQLGRIYFLNGKFDDAISEFDKELSNYPENFHPLYMRGLTNGYAKRYDEGIENFKKYIEWNPKTWAGYNDLVWIYLLKKDYQGAEEASRKGLKNSPENPWLLSNLGTALLNQKKYAEAKENLLLALEVVKTMKPSDWSEVYPGNSPKIASSGLKEMKAIMLLNLATIDKKLNQKEKARDYYQEYLDLLPENDERRISIEYFMMME